MTDITKQTLTSIVTANYQVATVMEKYNLDFCCKGNRILADACKERGLDLVKIIEELQVILGQNDKGNTPFTKMSAEQLISHILIHHHSYVKQFMPLIYTHLEKVVSKHRDKFPYMIQVFQLFSGIQLELTTHMQKEETILFSRIKEAERLTKTEGEANLPINYITGSLAKMEMEHERAGEIMSKIKELTSNYTSPEGACTTLKISLVELKEFEENLHEHVHLENNILFPLADQFDL